MLFVKLRRIRILMIRYKNLRNAGQGSDDKGDLGGFNQSFTVMTMTISAA
jgi:hypothetical protein